jgi:hypothetical protein
VECSVLELHAAAGERQVLAGLDLVAAVRPRDRLPATLCPRQQATGMSTHRAGQCSSRCSCLSLLSFLMATSLSRHGM